MPRTNDRAAASFTPEPLRRADPAHRPLAAEPSMLLSARSGVTKKASAIVGCAAGPSPRILQTPPRERLCEVDDWSDAEDADFAAGEMLLRLHAAELIDRLQRWACDLDVRQSQLNLQSASQDHRERQFRLWMQAREAELQERLEGAEQREKALRDSARRLALAELGNRP